METEKIILRVFLFCTGYILSVELFLKDLENPFSYMVRLGNIILMLSYSIVASYIFYLIVVYLPKRSKKRKLLINMEEKAKLINDLVNELVSNLKITGIDFKNFDELNEALKKINTDEVIYEYANFHVYLFYFKEKLVNIIRSLIIFHDFLDNDYLTELFLIENKLLTQIAFDGYKKFETNNLTYATITIQEILVHHEIFQKLLETEFKKNEKIINKQGENYRKRNNFN